MNPKYNLTAADPEHFPPEGFQLVWAVKHLRLLCTTQELGLKKAKEIIEYLILDPHSAGISVNGEPVSGDIYRNSVEQLKGCGLAVEMASAGPLLLLKQAASEALELGHHELSRDILTVLVNHEGN